MTPGWENRPHGVEQRAVVLQPQQLVGRGHVVSDGLLAVEEEGIGGPDVAGQQVVQRQHLHRPFEAQTLVLPALAEEDVDGVFLRAEGRFQRALFGPRSHAHVMSVNLVFTDVSALWSFHPNVLKGCQRQETFSSGEERSLSNFRASSLWIYPKQEFKVV